MQRLAVVAPRVAAVAAARATARAAPVRFNSTGRKEGPAALFYRFIFRRNITYATYIIAGTIAFETVYGGVTEGIWNSLNNGKTYATVDWSKFKTDEE